MTRFAPRRVACRALVLVVLLAGCTLPPEAVEERGSVVPMSTSAPTIATLVAPSVPDLALEVTLADPWIRPGETVVANATGSGSSFEWYLATRNPLARVPDAGPFVVAADERATLAVREPGRHSFAVEGSEARVNVSIVQRAVGLRLEAILVEEDGILRFAPEELVGGAGSTLRVANHAGVAATLTRADAMLPLEGSDPSIAFVMPEGIELGDYDVFAVARDGTGAVGVGSARLVYDNRKPDVAKEFGPFTGNFRLPPVPEPQTERHSWTSAHPLRSLEIGLSSSSDAPIAAGVRATLLGADGQVLAAIEDEHVRLTDLPKGDYALVVEQVDGALVQYRAEVRGEWTLIPPPSFFRQD